MPSDPRADLSGSHGSINEAAQTSSIPARHAAVEWRSRSRARSSLSVDRAHARMPPRALGAERQVADDQLAGRQSRTRPDRPRRAHRPMRAATAGLPAAVTRRPPVARRRAGGDRRRTPRCYLTVTVAPAPSRAAFAFSAASLVTFSRTVFGAPSTRSLASFRPRLVSVAHLLDDLDLLLAGRLEDDVELVLLLGLGLSGARRHRRPRARRQRRPERPR